MDWYSEFLLLIDLKTLIDLLIHQRLRTISGSSWFKSTICITTNLEDLKHQHPAGAFFLALIRGNSFESFEY